MVTVNWEWLENMVAGIAKGMPDGEEYQSFAMVWIYEKLEEYLRTHENPPNFRKLVIWSAGYYRRMRKVRDADSNIGEREDIFFERIDPADQVALRIDIAEFLEKLNENQSSVFRLTQEGFSNNEIAGILQKTPGRISQIRGEIRDKATVHLIEYY